MIIWNQNFNRLQLKVVSYQYVNAFELDNNAFVILSPLTTSSCVKYVEFF